MQAATFRARGRLPTFCWQHPRECPHPQAPRPAQHAALRQRVWDGGPGSGAVLSRSGQPKVGFMQSSRRWVPSSPSHAQTPRLTSSPFWTGCGSDADEALVAALGASGPNGEPRKLVIADARPRKNALANGALGGGSEPRGHYRYSEVVYLGIDNIHAVRESAQKLREYLEQFGSSQTMSVALVNLPTHHPPPTRSAAPLTLSLCGPSEKRRELGRELGRQHSSGCGGSCRHLLASARPQAAVWRCLHCRADQRGRGLCAGALQVTPQPPPSTSPPAASCHLHRVHYCGRAAVMGGIARRLCSAARWCCWTPTTARRRGSGRWWSCTGPPSATSSRSGWGLQPQRPRLPPLPRTRGVAPTTPQSSFSGSTAWRNSFASTPPPSTTAP